MTKLNWKNSIPSPCSTHHTLQGKPLYNERFDHVLPFREPGLAAVQKNNQAWHIFPNGKPAYTQTFQKTFNFYQQRAAVQQYNLWFHILPNAKPLYKERYSWTGNFCEGYATVRTTQGHYFHINQEGKKIYKQSWKYAGDFQNNIAVVQNEQGKSSHIYPNGKLLHNQWFLDLDVYHKGFARAKDQDGWMHINLQGQPIYRRRFAMVEPFYNGQARVEQFDGTLEIIDEQGHTIHTLRKPLHDNFSKLSQEIVGYWSTYTLVAAVELNIPQNLPNTTQKLAQQIHLKPQYLERFLRALASLHIVEQTPSQLWTLTEKGKLLLPQHHTSLVPAALILGKQMIHFWEKLPQALQKNSNWSPPPHFKLIQQWQNGATLTHQMIENYAKHDYLHIPPLLPLEKNQHLLDVGGGTGTLAKYILKHHPHLKITILEQPEVVKLGKKQLPTSYKNRIHFTTADLFQPWPCQGDAIILARVLHDWDNPQATKILQHAYNALQNNGQLLILEHLLPPNGYKGYLCDLHLLACLGGKDRTEYEYIQLLKNTGFSHVKTKSLPSVSSLIIAKK